MLLTIDVGNTNVTVGLYDNATLRDSFRVASNRSLTADEAGFFIAGLLQRIGVTNEAVEKVVLCSVVPSLTPVFEQVAKKYFGCIPVVVSARLDLPIKIALENPDQLGADRIANGVAAWTRARKAVIVVDFGTTTNFDVVNDQAEYIGGVLIPGPETSMTELARKAARLFEVRIEPPTHVVGRNTAEALKSGLFYGTVGQVDYLLWKIIEEAQLSEPVIIATGGLAGSVHKYSRFIQQTEPALTLEGLRLIAEFN